MLTVSAQCTAQTTKRHLSLIEYMKPVCNPMKLGWAVWATSQWFSFVWLTILQSIRFSYCESPFFVRETTVLCLPVNLPLMCNDASPPLLTHLSLSGQSKHQAMQRTCRDCSRKFFKCTKRTLGVKKYFYFWPDHTEITLKYNFWAEIHWEYLLIEAKLDNRFLNNVPM